MGELNEQLALLDKILDQIVRSWFERVKSNFVTEEESQQLGVEPEVKFFANPKDYRVKFSRTRELDVTYGLGAFEEDGTLYVESSVNNKSNRFDFDTFVEKLKAYYWRARNEKPWTHQDFDRFTNNDLMPFAPRLGETVTLDARKDKADIIRLHFPVNQRHQALLMANPEVLRDIIENYCLHPLKRIYAESYHGS
jgi:hypothetical protein